MKNRIKNIINAFIRFINSLKRPSKQRNVKLLHERGQTIDSFVIREAVAKDVPSLVALHVKTWNDTYGTVGPSHKIREYQWNEMFKHRDKNWFALIIENKDGELIGFAKGQTYNHTDLPEFNGELNKIYLLRDYQRLGLGRKLVGHVTQRLLDNGATNMVLFGTPQNPSCLFHEALGGERLHKGGDVFQGGYYWRDLRKLVTICMSNK
jgi:ribosomal protein S18 acetylase RimI-like enzyme